MQASLFRTLLILLACALLGAMLVSASTAPANPVAQPALQATADPGKGKPTQEANSDNQPAPTEVVAESDFTPTLLARLNVDYASNFVWNPDARTIFTHGPVDGLVAHPLDQLTLPQTLAEWEETAFSMTVAPGGLSLTFGARDKVMIYDARTGELTSTLTGPSSFVYGVRYSPDGLMLAAVDATGQLVLWDSMTETLLAQLQVDGYSAYGILFTPDGRQLITTGIEGDIKIWSVDDLIQQGENAQPSRVMPAESLDFVFCMEMSPDGETLATGMNAGNIMLWDFASGEPIARLAGHAEDIHTISFSADGHFLASGSDDWSVVVWNLETLESIATLSEHIAPITQVEFSPFGMTLVTQDNNGLTLVWGEEAR